VYQLPHDVFVSGTWQYYQGFPETTTVAVGNNTVSAHAGRPRRSRRAARHDASAAGRLRRFQRPEEVQSAAVRFEPRIDFYNMTNQASVIGRLTQLGPTYGRISNIQRGALIKDGLNVEF
jgi:hypothetical protein